jgi:L-ascorbate metabolism protein UlaG (beta-lactamase superfamily)
MQIIWHGQACFQIILNRNKDEKLVITIDPFSEEVGLKLHSVEADILLITHDHHDHNNKKAISGKPFLIEGPGEYEIKGVFIRGIEASHDKSQGKERGKITIYTIEAEEMKICHLGDLGQKELTLEQVEQIGDIDILMIPVGGIYTISAQDSPKIISQIEPKIVIPMHYFLPKLKIKLEGLDKFLKIMGQKEVEPQGKLQIKNKDLLTEKMKVVVLKP